jgi:hypothetical protein
MERDPRTDTPAMGWILSLLWISFLVLFAICTDPPAPEIVIPGRQY